MSAIPRSWPPSDREPARPRGRGCRRRSGTRGPTGLPADEPHRRQPGARELLDVAEQPVAVGGHALHDRSYQVGGARVIERLVNPAGPACRRRGALTRQPGVKMTPLAPGGDVAASAVISGKSIGSPRRREPLEPFERLGPVSWLLMTRYESLVSPGTAAIEWVTSVFSWAPGN